MDDHEAANPETFPDHRAPDGRFPIERIQPGPFALRASRIGYAQTETPYWQVKGGEMLTVVVRVDRNAVVLAPLEITARPSSSSPVLAGFYRD